MTTSAPPPSQFPERSAWASLRGYLYQFETTVLRWLELQDGETLVCEANEDVDRYLLGGSLSMEQIKRLEGRLGPTSRAVVESLKAYLRFFVARLDDPRPASWKFTTTAGLRRPRRGGPDLRLWHEPSEQEAVRGFIRQIAPDDAKRLDDDNAWSTFIASVEWNFDAPSTAEVRERVRVRISERWPRLPTALVEDRLLAAVLKASVERELSLRVLDVATRDQVGALTTDALRESASEHPLAPQLAAALAETLDAALDARATRDRGNALSRLLDDGFEPLPDEPLPSDLLRAGSAVVPFTGREKELAWLDDWLQQTSSRVALVHGPGGVGKTRLLLQWAHALRTSGIPAGFLSSDATDLAPLLDGDAPRVVIVDYAEARVSAVEALLRGAAKAGGIRIVLAARHDGEWWRQLGIADYQSRRLVARAAILQLDAIATDASQRRALWALSAERFRAEIDYQGPALDIPALDEDYFELPLYIEMSALVAVFGEAKAGSELTRAVLQHEQRYWWNAARDRGLTPLELTAFNIQAEKLVVLLALWGGAHGIEGLQEMANQLPSDHPTVRLAAVAIISDLYGTQTGHIRPLGPDPIAEGLIEESCRRHPRLLETALGSSDLRRLRSAWTVLGRVGAHSSGAPILERAIETHMVEHGPLLLEVAPAIGSHFGNALAVALGRHGDAELASQWLDRMPEHTLVLGAVKQAALPLALTLATRKADTAEEARLSHNMAVLLAEHHKFEEAIEWVDRAIEAYRREVSDGGAPINLPLTMSMRAQLLAEVGRLEEAERSAIETLGVLRGWMAIPDARDKVEEHFVGCLSRVGWILRRAGRHGDALKCFQEAGAVARELRATDAQRLQGAAALNGTGVVLSDLGELNEALAAMEQAAELLRECAVANPDAYAPLYAHALTNLTSALLTSGRYSEAEDCARRAVELLRPLAEGWPAQLKPLLAGALNNLSLVLGVRGKTADALRASMDAISLLREASCSRDLAQALSSASRWAGEAGSVAQAREFAAEAVAIVDRALDQASYDDRRLLASLLVNLSRVAPSGEGRAAAERAVQLLRQLSAGKPDVHEPTLAQALINRSALLHAAGAHPAAEADVRSAVTILRRLHVKAPNAYAADLATALSTLAVRLRETRATTEALEASAEAVDVARGLAEREPGFIPLLARSLVNLAVQYSDVGQDDLAIACARDAAASLLAAGEPSGQSALETLAQALLNLSIHLSRKGLADGAADAAEQAVRWQTILAAHEPSQQLKLCRALIHVAELRVAAGRPDSGEPAARAAEILGPLAEQDPAYVPILEQAAALAGAAAPTPVTKARSALKRRKQALKKQQARTKRKP